MSEATLVGFDGRHTVLGLSFSLSHTPMPWDVPPLILFQSLTGIIGGAIRPLFSGSMVLLFLARFVLRVSGRFGSQASF